MKEHLWLFSHKKEACPEICMKRHKCSSSDSALWRHSKEAHGGTLRVEDWRVTLTSPHRGALNRQVTEAVKISNEGLGSLLNSKHEFGSNNLSELAVKKGNTLVGEAKRKRQEEGNSEEETKATEASVAVREVKIEVHVKEGGEGRGGGEDRGGGGNGGGIGGGVQEAEDHKHQRSHPNKE